MNLGRGWLFLLPLLAFIATAMLLSCGGNSGCGNTYDELGAVIPNSGTCVNGPGITPAPSNGSIVSISICPGPPLPPTPLPTVTTSATPAPNPTPLPCPTFTGASIPQGCFIQFHAVATLNNVPAPLPGHPGRLINETIDITNDATSNWTSSEPAELSPETLQGTQGIYSALGAGPSVDAVVSVPGISSSPVAVTIGTPVAVCPTIVLLPSTPGPTPTP